MPKTKRKGLADRIREQRNLSDKDRQKEKDLLSLVSQRACKDEKTSDEKSENDTGTVVQRSSGTCTGACTSTVVQRYSELCTGTCTSKEVQRSSGTEVYRSSGTVLRNERVIFDPAKKPRDLTMDQFRILHFVYFNRPFKLRSNKGLAIGDLINPTMTAPNVRNKLVSLVKKGYIEKPFSVNNGISQGSTCRVNLEKCILLFGKSGLDETGTVIQWSTGPVVQRSSGTVPSSYSSSLLYKTTTGPMDLSDPDLAYWSENGLTDDKIRKWVKEFKLSEGVIVNSLRWAKFDLVDNGKEKFIKEDVQSWFYGSLKKGGYSKPVNFKSHQQKMIEKEKAELEIMKAEVEKLEALRKQKQDVRMTLEFESMMSDPEGELYKKCFESFPDIQKKRYSNSSTKQGQSFEREMKRALHRIINSGPG